MLFFSGKVKYHIEQDRLRRKRGDFYFSKYATEKCVWFMLLVLGCFIPRYLNINLLSRYLSRDLMVMGSKFLISLAQLLLMCDYFVSCWYVKSKYFISYLSQAISSHFVFVFLFLLFLVSHSYGLASTLKSYNDRLKQLKVYRSATAP